MIERLNIRPDTAYTNTPLTVDFEAHDPDGDNFSTSFRWSLNGTEISGETNSQLGSELFAKGDTVSVLITLEDGTETTSQSTEIHILNSPPQALANAETPVAGRSEVSLNGQAEDVDGDSLYFSWVQIDGPEVELRNADSDTASFTSPTHNGELAFQFIVGDGEDYSDPVEVRVLVQTTPPQITGLQVSPDPAFTNSELRAVSSVSNPDNSDLSYVYNWMVNGELIDEVMGETLPPEHFQKNDVVTLTLQVTDGYNGDAESAEITISDSDPIITLVGMPAVANYGEPLSFQVQVEDIDDDSYGFNFLTRPNGMEINEAGTVTWLPTGPLFTSETDFNWKLELTSGEILETIAGTIRVVDGDRPYPLSRSGFEYNYDRKGMILGDFDANGTNELLTHDRDKRLFTMTFDGGDFVQEWYYPFSLVEDYARLNDIAASDLDGNGKAEFIVGTDVTISPSYLTQAQILIIDDETREIENFTTVNGDTVYEVFPEDLDRDGQKEIVALVRNRAGSVGRHLEIRHPETLELVWQSDTLELGDSATVRSINNGESLQIATSSGQLFSYVDGEYILLSEYPEGFGARLSAADLDGDGTQEIVGLTNSLTAIRIFKSSEHSTTIQPDVSGLSYTIAPKNNSGIEELIIGDTVLGQSKLIAYSFNPDVSPNAIETWSMEVPRTSFGFIVAGDVDNMEGNEIFWGGSNVLDADNDIAIYLAHRDPSGNMAIKWENSQIARLEGPFLGGMVMTSPKGEKELAFANASTGNGNDGSRLISFSPESANIEVSPKISRNWERELSLSVVDHDHDGIDSIFLASHEVYDSYLGIYDFYNSLETRLPLTLPDNAQAVTHGNIDGKDSVEIIATFWDGAIHAYDAITQQLVWKSDSGGGIDVIVEDLNDDGIAEIIGASFNNGITIFSKENDSYSVSNHLDLYGIYDIAVGDLDLDGNLEIIAATPEQLESVHVFENNLTKRSSFSIDGSYVITNVAVENYGVSNRNLLLAAHTCCYSDISNNYLAIVDPNSGEVIYRSPEIPGYIPRTNNIHFVDIDGDEIPEISYGTDQSMNITR